MTTAPSGGHMHEGRLLAGERCPAVAVPYKRAMCGKQGALSLSQRLGRRSKVGLEPVATAQLIA